jgi:presequence protease
MGIEAFELVRETELGELRSRGRFFRHRATGMEIFHLLNEDPENLFSFAFRTPPVDSTGVAHILEHSVLCGSRRYPLKDAFISLAKGSLNTFLNAMTHGDRTVYPAATIVERDYFNLFDAYADAVFFPLLKEEAFLQEGHRLVPLAGGAAEIQGIVYSEMQGVYSSPENILDDRAFRILFENGHPYSQGSGGDPDEIPALDYASFRAFHARHYHPSNCRLFLYGNIPTEGQLEFLEAGFLSSFGPGEPVPPVPLQSPFQAPKRQEIAYPAPETGGRSSVLVSWLLGDSADPLQAIEAEILSEIILGHDGSPLGRALRECGLGEDLAPQSGIGTDARQMGFQAGLRGIRREDSGAVEEKIFSVLKGLRDGGIPPGALEAALRGVEFSYREIRRGSGPYALRIMQRCMRGWIHGFDPERTLRVLDAVKTARGAAEKGDRHFEDLLDRLLVSNPHRALTLAYPEEGLGEKRREALALSCARKLGGLGKEGRKALDGALARLKRFQEEPDGPEALAALPRVRVADLPRAIDLIPTEPEKAAGMEARYHPVFTNGISYAEIAVDISGLDPSLLPWLPLFTRFISSAGVPGVPYHEMAERLASAAGGFSCVLQTGSHAAAADADNPSVLAVFRLKALDSSLDEALSLARDVLLHADSSDVPRLLNLYTELRNDLLAALIPSGVSFAQSRGAATFSVAGAVEESWRGVTQYDFLMSLGESPDLSSIASAMEGIRSSLFPGAKALASITSDPSSKHASLAALEDFSRDLSLGAFSPGPGHARGRILPRALGVRNEAFVIPAEVGFASAALRGSRLKDPGYPAETVLASILSSGPLWESVRMRRGAYGAWADADPLEGVFGMASYRDPGPLESLLDFRAALSWASGPGMDREVTDKGILSVVSNDIRPLSPEEKGFVDLKRAIFGVDDESRKRKREGLLSLDPEKVMAAAARVLDGWSSSVQTIVAGEASLPSARTQEAGMVVRKLEL